MEAKFNSSFTLHCGCVAGGGGRSLNKLLVGWVTHRGGTDNWSGGQVGSFRGRDDQGEPRGRGGQDRTRGRGHEMNTKEEENEKKE